MKHLKVVQRITLGEQVALQIAGMISDGRWVPGDKLPTESDLCGALGVGRSTLREALKSLAFIGLVRMRAGDGTYVSEPRHGLLDRILTQGLLKSEQSLADVCETRTVLETELAAFAAERATPDDLNAIKTLLDRGTELVERDPKAYSGIDLEFHLTVANCSHNKVLALLLMDIRDLLAEWIVKSQELPGLVANAHDQHKRIFRCIADHDPAGARKEMRAHLETFQRAYSLLGRLSNPTSPPKTANDLSALPLAFSAIDTASTPS